MILVDANLLIYAYDEGSPHHRAARTWLERALSGSEPVRLPVVAVLAFIRILTNARIYPAAATPAEAIEIVQRWLAQPNVGIAEPSERHWDVLRAATESGQATGPLVMDAHLAALTIEHGGTLYTTDRGFARFPKLRFRNPIAG